MSDAKLTKFTAKREVVIGQIKRVEDFVNTELNQASVTVIELRLSALEKYYDNFNTYQELLEELDNEEIKKTTRASIEELHFKLKPILKTQLSILQKYHVKEFSAPVPEKECTSLDLPKIKLPTFAGDITQWLSFFDAFNTLVHKSQRLDDVAKFQHLKSSLQGPALNRIKSIEMTSKNYHAALKLLTDRYSNKRLIAQEHIKALFNIPSMEKGAPAKLRDILDHFHNHLESLKSLGRPTAHWDDLIVFLILSKLDVATRTKWEEECPEARLPSVDELTTFLEHRLQTLEGINSIKAQSQSTSNQPANRSRPKSHHVTSQQSSMLTSSTNNNRLCSFCSQPKHNIYRCRRFLALSPTERHNEASRLNLCMNCLKTNHPTNLCRSLGCNECQSKHHTFLHQFSANPNQNSTASNARAPPSESITGPHPGTTTESQAAVSLHQSQISRTIQSSSQCQILLATAVINVLDKYGLPITCRALLDSGSQLHFVSERFAQQLGLARSKLEGPIAGIGNIKMNVNESININISSRLSSFCAQIEAYIIPNITGYQPHSFIDIENWSLPSHVELADPQFNHPQRIDLLIGAELYCNLLTQGQIQLHDNMPTLQNTTLGWIVTGKHQHPSSIPQCSFVAINSTPSLEEIVQQFWEIERHDSPTNTLTIEESECEQYFAKTVKRHSTGRYIVRLPFRSSPTHLGNSKNIAIKRFLNGERKFQRNAVLQQQYTTFMSDYHILGHMEEIAPSALPDLHYFLPHHCIEKPDSSSTKLRVVFDGSAKTSSKLSLNDLLMVGATVQPDLFSIITQFRIHRYVFTADISKMYRQILIDEADRTFQCIVWRDRPEDDLKIFRLNTVTYGTSAAPYLATRCLIQLAEDEGSAYPLAAKVLRENFYVDDVMSGGSTIEEVIQLQNDLIILLNKGGFQLRKYCANHKDILESIPVADREEFLNIHNNEVVKTLGLIWQPNQDCFQFNILPANHDTQTKRAILSDLAKVFDPLGLIGPVVILGKIFLQQLWKLKLKWDDILPEDLHTRWSNYRSQFHELNTLKIKRHILASTTVEDIQLHSFSDSSEVAYGACCYLRSLDTSGHISVNLICSKSRVVPLKNTTLPRLELCAAVLMTELTQRLIKILPIKINSVVYWTDSTIVLSWLASPSYTWTTFVANRIAKIQDLSDMKDWKHVNTSHNPADLISRGMLPSQLCASNEWFNGPSFLSEPESNWPSSSINIPIDLPEFRTQKISLIATDADSSPDFIENIRHSNSFKKLQHIIAYCLRFGSNSRLRAEKRYMGPLTPNDLEGALRSIVKYVQQRSFTSELTSLHKNSQVEKTSRLRSLSPFLDSNGLLRVGGRIQNSSIPFESKHQILLPYDSPLTYNLMFYLHVKHLHAAPQALLAITRQRFWPLNGKLLSRRIVNRCFRCFKTKPKSIEHMMGNLPVERVTPARPFYTTGIDFCGPVKIHFRIRGKTPAKAYIAIFICFTTRAVHIEVVTDLTTQAFISSLKRFVARRGLCHTIFCDNAANFVGARSELHDLYNLFCTEDLRNQIQNWCHEDRIHWKPIPPKSPHFGGLWEAAVKSAKHHLVRFIGNASLTFEELNTTVTQIEAVLNSRPMTPMSSDPNDLEALTPGHFLVGGPLTAIVEPDMKDAKIPLTARHHHIRKIHQQFWYRWSTEYLNLLQQRHKWSKLTKNLHVGQLVLLKEDNLPPLKWLTGRITSLHPGKDNIIRVVDVKTKNGTFRRSTTKLCPFPEETMI